MRHFYGIRALKSSGRSINSLIMDLETKSGDNLMADDGVGGGGVGDADLEDESSVLCTICLETVVDNGERSPVKLQCSHQFHLDCIGSAFNAKGAMQCPNCRRIETGRWRFANGYRSYPESSINGLAQVEDHYDQNQTQTQMASQLYTQRELASLQDRVSALEAQMQCLREQDEERFSQMEERLNNRMDQRLEAMFHAAGINIPSTFSSRDASGSTADAGGHDNGDGERPGSQ